VLRIRARRCRVDPVGELGDLGLRQVRGQIRFADHADEPVLLGDWQPPDLMLLHEPEHVAIVGVGVDPDRLALGQIASRGRLGVAALGQAPHHDVAVGGYSLPSFPQRRLQ
jgi:hypothetical protein